jgi:hypothetical protein
MMSDEQDQPAAVGREAIKQRGRYDGLCRECGKPFRGYLSKVFCSQKCYMRAYRRRQAGR